MPDELTRVEPRELAPDELFAAVLRAAENPTTEPARLREFLAIATELRAERRKELFDTDFAAVKKELPVILKNGVVLNKSGKVQFKYARYDDLHEAITPILDKYGFATSFNFEEPEKGRLKCTLEISHGGHSKFYSWTLPSMGENQYVNNLQNAAAARSFAKRCVLIDALDILTKDADTGGVTNTPGPEPITEEQIRKIEDMLAACEQVEPGNRSRFLKWVRGEMQGVEKISDLHQGLQHNAVTVMLKAKMRGLGITK